MELLQKIRSFSTVPVIFLTSKDDELDEALGLGMGADDYITKPFSQRLLLARIRAVLRRATDDGMDPEGPNVVRQGDLLMDPDRHLCSWKEKEVRLTVTEFLILQALASRPGMVKNRDQQYRNTLRDRLQIQGQLRGRGTACLARQHGRKRISPWALFWPHTQLFRK